MTDDDDWSYFSIETDKQESLEQQHEQLKKQENVCTNCNTSLIKELINDGFLVCTGCGTVQNVFIDSSAEWRCFNTDNGKDLSGVRCGDIANTLLPGTQLNTFIGGKDKRLQRVHQWNNLSAKERNLHQIFKEFEHIGNIHNLPKGIIAFAADLYRRLYIEMENKNCGVKRCNVRQGLKSACLYFACKQMNIPRERKEIAEMLGSTIKVVTKGCNSFLDIMGGDFVKMDPFKPEDFVARFCQLLDIPYYYQSKLETIVKYVAKLDILSDNTPTSVASACVYFLSIEFSLAITKDDIHEKCGSSQIIITKTYNKIQVFREKILDNLKE